MRITKSQLRQIIKEEILKEFDNPDLDLKLKILEDLPLIYDKQYGPDYVAGSLADQFPALDTDAKHEKLLGMLRDAASRQDDITLQFLANRIAELANK